jgi:prolipoprotein diacylglyceryltransferase
LQGLASHGGAISILLALWFYARKKKLSYLHVLDRIVILVALTAAFIRLGNYFNSEIIGKPTDSELGVVFVNSLEQNIISKNVDSNLVETIGIVKNTAVRDSLTETGQVPILLYLFFKPGVADQAMRAYLDQKIKPFLYNESDFFYIDILSPLNFYFIHQDNGSLAVKIPVVGIARHPAQLYESISCVLLFIALFLIWKRYNGNPPEGRIFGIFMITLWGLRFCYEFLKKNQVSFESSLPINMGQILSIPLFVAGIIILIRSYKKLAQA